MIDLIHATQWVKLNLRPHSNLYSSITDTDVMNVLRKEFNNEWIDKLMLRLILVRADCFPLNPLGKHWNLSIDLENSEIVHKLTKKPHYLTDKQKRSILQKSQKEFKNKAKFILDTYKH